MWLLNRRNGPVSELPLADQRVNGPQALLKSAPQHLYLIVSLFSYKVSSKTCLLTKSGILGLFVNNLTADECYSRDNRVNFSQPIQMQLFKKLKTFPQFLIEFLKSTSNFEHFEKKKKMSLKYFLNY